MSNNFHDYQEEIKSIQKQIAEIKINLRLIEERKSEYAEQHKIPLDLVKEQKKQEAKLVDLRERQGQLLDTVADLSDRSKILSLEPYLLNRIEQELALLQVLKKQNQTKNKLLVCLIYGDKQQSQDTFLERLKKYFFPKIFQETTITIYHLQFPENLKSFNTQLQYKLAQTILDGECTELNEEINDRLAQSPVPVIIYSNIYYDHWLKDGCEAIKSFLDFWETWPVLCPGQHLFVFLFINYSSQQHHGIFERFRFRFAGRENSRLNKELKKLIDTFSSSNFSHFNNFCGIVLPKFEGITEQQAMDWVDTVSRKHFSGNLAFLVDTKLEIQAIFNQWKSKDLPKRIPMDKLARRLRGILYEYTARRELA